MMTGPDRYPLPSSEAGSPYVLSSSDGDGLPTASGAVLEGVLAGLNEQQREAVMHDGPPLMVVAGPGSGKTRVLTCRVARLVEDGLSPYELLVVTFTNKAAAELRGRLTGMIGPQAERMWISTFHSACARILRYDGDRIGLPPRFSILDTQDSLKVLRKVLASGPADVDAKELRTIRDEVSKVKSSAGGAAALAASSHAADRAFAGTVAAYDAELRRIGAVDFDDLLLLAWQLLSSDGEVRAKYQSRFRHVLVDEYQDTNQVQVQLVDLLAAPQRQLFVVGDAQQSIYSWRGAEPGVMHGLLDRYPDARVVLLDVNYRSADPVLEVVRAVVEPVRDELVPALVPPEPRPGPPVRLVVASDDREEARFIAGELAGMMVGREPDDGYSRTRSTASSSGHGAAVLLRTNAQSRVLEEALMSQAVPYRVVGALRFYDRAEVKDALSYLRLVENRYDVTALTRCVNTPRRGLGDRAVDWLLQYADDSHDGDLVAAVSAAPTASGAPARARRGFEELAGLLAEVDAGLDVSPEEALRRVSDGGLRAALEQDRSNVDRAENLDELLSAAAQFTPPGRSDGMSGREMSGLFLEHVALLSAADLSDDPDAGMQVEVLTVHAAKGREFDAVYVAGLEDGYFPHDRARSDADVAEERRLLFVACSRAERRLTLSYARSRFMFNDRRDRTPSPFLDDLPASVAVSHVGAPSGRTPGSSRASRPVRPWSPPAPRPSGGSAAAETPSQVRTVRPTPVPGPRLSADVLSAGVKVVHPRFGTGEVVKVASDRVDVRFDCGMRTLELEFAPLTLV